MKKLIIFPIILGTLLLIGGGALFAIGISKREKANLKEETYTIEAFTKFDLQTKTSDIDLRVSDDDTYSVKVMEYEKMPHTVKVEDGTLKITQKDNYNWYERIFNFSLQREVVTVYAPAGAYASFKLDCNTGDLDIPNDFSFTTFDAINNTGKITIKSSASEYIKIKNDTGDVRIDSVNTGAMEVKTNTGNVELTKVNVTNNVKVDVDTGNIILKETTFKNLNTVSHTGNVKIINSVGTGDTTIKTSTGNVTFDAADSYNITVTTDTGDVKGTLLTGKLFSASSGTGTVKVPDDDPATGGKCKITSHAGDIKITIAA